MPSKAALQPDRLSVCALRGARRMAYWNGGLWSIGNGLADRYEGTVFALGDAWRMDHYAALFLWLMRMLGVVVLLGLVREPGRAQA